MHDNVYCGVLYMFSSGTAAVRQHGERLHKPVGILQRLHGDSLFRYLIALTPLVLIRTTAAVCQDVSGLGHQCVNTKNDVDTLPLFAPFIYKMHHFTKTGSGQT